MILPSIGGHVFPPVLQQQAEPTVNVNAAHACQKCAMPNNHNSGIGISSVYNKHSENSLGVKLERGNYEENIVGMTLDIRSSLPDSYR
jgi:hypothetical protein